MLVLFGAARAFAMPTSQAIMPNLVPREKFGNAVALNSSTLHVATIVGPSLGGLMFVPARPVVYASRGAAAAHRVLLLAVRLAAAIRSRPSRPLAHPARRAAFRRSRPVVLGAISLDLFAVLFGGATALLPVFARTFCTSGPGGLGLLRTAPAVGAALTAVMLALAPITRASVAGCSPACRVWRCNDRVWPVGQFWLSLAALVVLGAGDMVSVYIRHMLIQLETPDEIRGRVSAVNAVFIGASNELGEFESGLTAAWFGLVPSVVIGGSATLAVTGLWMRLFPSLRTMDRFPGSAP